MARKVLMSQNDDHIGDRAEDLSRTLASTKPLYELGSIIGAYKLLNVLGEGGFGVVYLAEQEHPIKRLVAMKVIKPGMDTKQVIARFETERQALAMLDHPNIAKVFDGGTTDTGRPYFVMELVRGIPITEYCDKNKLDTRQRLELFVQVCNAVQHAHQKGIIHRDIKPSNVLLTLLDGAPVPKVIDFGVAKATNQRLTERTLFTEQAQMVGTPEYMSPEQAEVTSLDVDTRTDIYSLGVLLYELLTGCTPFDAQDLRSKGYAQMQRVICETEPQRPSTKLSTLGPRLTDVARLRQTHPEMLSRLIRGDLDWIVMKCLEKDRTRRYETSHGLADDIDRHLRDEPISAGRPTTLHRCRKFVRRNKVTCTAATVVAVALVVGAVISADQAVRATRARNDARQQRRDAQIQRDKAQVARKVAEEERQKAAANERTARRNAYASDMSLAQQALATNNLGRAQELLNRHRPGPGEPDLRGWEWRYLWQRCCSDAEFTLCEKSSRIHSLAASADGRWLAVGEFDKGGLTIWDLTTRQEVVQLRAGEERVWLAWSPQGRLLAVGELEPLSPPTQGWSIRLWDGAARNTVSRIPLAGGLRGLVFSQDGRSLATLSADREGQGEIVIWSVPEGRKLVSWSVPDCTWRHEVGPHLAASRDLRVAAYIFDGDRQIGLMDLATGEKRWTANHPSGECFISLALSPDGSTLATGSGFAESAVRLWEVASGKEIGRLEGHRAPVFDLLYWPDGKTLASASGDQTIRLWDATTRRCIGTLRGHHLEVWRLALLPDNTTLLSGCKDGSVCVWDTTKTRRNRGPALLRLQRRNHWHFDANGRGVFTLDSEGRVAYWQGPDFQTMQPLPDVGPALLVGGNAFSADGRLLGAGSMDGIVRVWDLQQRRLLHELKTGDGVVGFAGFLGQEKIVTVSRYEAHEWDLQSLRETRSYRVPTNLVTSAISDDGRWAIALGWRGECWLRDLVAGQETTAHLDLKEVVGVAFSHDGGYFAAASEYGYARLWETPTLREGATFKGVLMGIHSVAFSPDGKRLAAGGDASEAVRVWDVESGQELLTLDGEGSGYQESAFSADGSLLGSMNDTDVLHLWRAPSWEEIEAAGKHEGSYGTER
jgi:serine/threonine protein kinase/WD40 repeat protein